MRFVNDDLACKARARYAFSDRVASLQVAAFQIWAKAHWKTRLARGQKYKLFIYEKSVATLAASGMRFNRTDCRDQNADLMTAPEASCRWFGLAGSHHRRNACPRRGGGPCQGIRSCRVVV